MLTREAFDGEIRRFEKENNATLSNGIKGAFWDVCASRTVAFLKGTLEKATGYLEKRRANN